MAEVNVTEFRQHMPQYLEKLRYGGELLLTSRGRVVARLLPPPDRQEEARRILTVLRSQAEIGDVTSPLDLEWDDEDAGA